MTAAIKLAVCLQKWLQQVHMSHVMSPGKTTICLKAIFTQQNSSINFVSCPFRDLLVTCPLTFLLKKHEDDRERVCGVHCVPLREESPALRAAPSVRMRPTGRKDATG